MATGLKQGYWIVLNSVKKLPDYPAEAKVEEGKYTDSKKIGVWKNYFANGNIKSEITFTNNRPSGYAKMYYENGKVQKVIGRTTDGQVLINHIMRTGSPFMFSLTPLPENAKANKNIFMRTARS